MTNPFGGGNAGSLYTPMSDDEIEVVARLVEADDLRVIIGGWGHVDHPRVTFGDLRVAIAFQLNFDRPEAPIPVHSFDLELRTHSGLLLFAQRQSAVYNGQPLQIASGVVLDMVWDIAIRSMDPAIVRQIKPGARGLTSRWQDRDTGAMSLFGNANLTPDQRVLLVRLRAAEDRIRAGREPS